MFHGLEDGSLLAFGWPYHGLIVEDSLDLPSGKSIQCLHGGWETQLWDIGLPDPGINSDDPDEQWLERAIIRGLDSSSVIYSGKAGGGALPSTAYSAPVRVGGELYRRYRLNLPSGSLGDAEYWLSGALTASASVSRADLGLPSDYTARISSSFLDSDLSRGRWLVRVTQFGTGLPLAIVLLELSVGADGHRLTASVLAGYEVVGLYTGYVNSPLNIPRSQRVRWNSGGIETWAQSGEGVIGQYVPIGDHIASARGSCVIGAWFKDNGDIEQQLGWLETEQWYRCLDPAQYSQTIEMGASGRVLVESADGTRISNPLSFEFAIEIWRGQNEYTWTIKRLLNGELIEEQSGAGTSFFPLIPEGDISSWGGLGGQAAGNQFGVDMHPGLGWWQNFVTATTGFRGSVLGNRASNKLRQPFAAIDRQDGTTAAVYGHAIHPRGVESKTTGYDSRQDPWAATIARGTYNPITGAVILNPTDGLRYSWV